MPSLRNSPTIRGEPQPLLASSILRINALISFGKGGLPGLPCLLSSAQWSRKRLPCQAITVLVWTMTYAYRHPGQWRESQDQRIRSPLLIRGRLVVR